MQTLKQTQVTEPKKQQDNRQASSTYMQPKITVYKEEDILKTVAILGCYPNPF